MITHDDKTSLWKSKDPVVKKCLKVAYRHSQRSRVAMEYRERMKDDWKKMVHKLLPNSEVGQLAALQISKKAREASKITTDTSNCMYVKLVKEPKPSAQPRKFIFVSCWYHQGEDHSSRAEA